MPFHPDGPGFAGDHTWWASGGWHIVPLLMFVLFIGVVVWAVLRLTSSKTMTAPTTGVRAQRADAALDEVRVRYARGEMSREEFVQRFHDLGGQSVEAAPTVPSVGPPADPVPPTEPTEPTPPAA
jgi:uncharacterized membrane protein